MDIVDIIMLIVCVPLLIMMGILVYILIAMMLKEESDIYIWPFKKKESIHCACTDEEVEKSFISDVEAVKDLLPDKEEK